MKQYVEPESGVTTLNIIVDNCEQCGQQNIVQPVRNNIATSGCFFLLCTTVV
jgi:hypothetical protein